MSGKTLSNDGTKEIINNETTSYNTAISISSTKHTSVDSNGEEILYTKIKSETSIQQSSLGLNLTSSIITSKSAYTTLSTTSSKSIKMV